MTHENVDQDEIAKFSEFASHWWDPQGEMKVLHEINPLRLQYINESAPLAGKRVLDIGCGGGILSEAMARCHADVTAIDMSASALDVAKLHQIESKLHIEYLLTTAEEFAAQRPDHYDVVTCLEMLEHVPDPSAIVQAAAKLVKPGGDVFFSTLNRNMKSYLYAIVGAEYILKILPKNTHDYAKFIRPSELAAWARNAGLTVKQMTGINYHLLTKKYTLDPDVSVNYLIHMKKR